jgi:hypothetical protein
MNAWASWVIEIVLLLSNDVSIFHLNVGIFNGSAVNPFHSLMHSLELTFYLSPPPSSPCWVSLTHTHTQLNPFCKLSYALTLASFYCRILWWLGGGFIHFAYIFHVLVELVLWITCCIIFLFECFVISMEWWDHLRTNVDGYWSDDIVDT